MSQALLAKEALKIRNTQKLVPKRCASTNITERISTQIPTPINNMRRTRRRSISSHRGRSELSQRVIPETQEPRATAPRVTDPRVNEPRVIEPRVNEPRVNEPRVIEPRVIEPRVIEPRVIEPRVNERGRPATRVTAAPMQQQGVATIVTHLERLRVDFQTYMEDVGRGIRGIMTRLNQNANNQYDDNVLKRTAQLYGINLTVDYDHVTPDGQTVDLSQIPLDPAKPSKYHSNILRILFTSEELAEGLVARTKSKRPQLDERRLNILKACILRKIGAKNFTDNWKAIKNSLNQICYDEAKKYEPQEALPNLEDYNETGHNDTIEIEDFEFDDEQFEPSFLDENGLEE